MSSRVIEPGNGLPFHPVSWKQVNRTGEEARRVAGEVERDFTARMASVEARWEQRVREAHAAGFREGEAEGHRRAAEEVEPILSRLARSIDDLAQFRPRLRREAEAEMVKLALAIARRVLRREVSADPDALQGLVRYALEKLAGQEVSRVRVHASHAARVAAWLSQEGSGVEVIPDAGCEPGGVIFETTRGNLNASVDSQLLEIERGLADRLGKDA
jgi:flagellar assembly protein FliH